MSAGSRSNCADAHEGQTNGIPVRSLAIRFSACAGLYEAGRGLRMYPPNCGPFGRSGVLCQGRCHNSNHFGKGRQRPACVILFPIPDLLRGVFSLRGDWLGFTILRAAAQLLG